MTKFVSFLCLAAVATPSLAESFSHAGTTYTYAVAERGGTRIITGTDDRGTTYLLRVRGTRVEGEVDGRVVTFSTRNLKPIVARSDDADARVASR